MTTRREVLRLIAGTLAVTGVVGCRGEDGAMTTEPTDAVEPPERFAYGSDASQWGELHRPAGPSRGTVVVIHGGFWRDAFGAELGTPLAIDLAAHGWTAWNIEYRRLGNGGGWPTTFEDVAAAIDHLAVLAADVGPDVIDLARVVALGHSAGGHLAVWAAGRPGLGAGAPGGAARVPLAGAVSQAGVLDLTDGLALSGGVVTVLLGGRPDEVPDRYAVADPIARVPVTVPVRCVHGRDDDIVPLRQSERYVAAAVAAGADAELAVVDGDHFAVIDIADPAWPVVRAAIADLTTG